jgi:hypothetical protein
MGEHCCHATDLPLPGAVAALAFRVMPCAALHPPTGELPGKTNVRAMLHLASIMLA